MKPDDIQGIGDLQKLPFLTKDIIRKNFKNLIAVNYPTKKFQYQTTGGTTGTPLGFYVEKDAWYAEELAYQKIVINRAGYNLRGRFLYLREASIRSSDKDKFWNYVFFGKSLILSSYHMSKENLLKYIEKIRHFKPKFIIAYPSSISLLAGFMKNNNINLSHEIEFILLSGENIYDWQQSLLKEIFQCKILSSYGNAERTAWAASCEKSDYYHFFPEYGIVEFVDKKSRSLKNEGEKGEIVGTGFHNYIFPFIRYKTGDIGIYTNKKCLCGRNYPLLKNIHGRSHQFVVSRTQSYIPISGLYGLVAKSSNNVIDTQLYQDSPGKIVLMIMRSRTYSEIDEQNILSNFQKKFGSEIELIVDYVDDIPRTPRGKHQFLIQKLPIDLTY
jgi:phenylacetate-CoA ligase